MPAHLNYYLKKHKQRIIPTWILAYTSFFTKKKHYIYYPVPNNKNKQWKNLLPSPNSWLGSIQKMECILHKPSKERNGSRLWVNRLTLMFDNALSESFRKCKTLKCKLYILHIFKKHLPNSESKALAVSFSLL